MENGKKAYLDYTDIMKRYGVGVNRAYGILSAIRKVCGGGCLPAGKCLPSELEYWEDYRNHIQEPRLGRRTT